MRVAVRLGGAMMAIMVGVSGAGLSHAGAAEVSDTLYVELGGRAGIDRIVEGAFGLFLRDDRVRTDFEETDPVRLKTRLASQICHLAGGPCVAGSRSMAESHAALHVDRARFNAVAEDLQQAMEDVGVPYWTQNRLMALLAPMQRDIVTR